ncbi:hypothetical protein N9Y42_00020 [Mariniblastus sp.]|nr:hypothetical protein [Mariniblastus sp.]
MLKHLQFSIREMFLIIACAALLLHTLLPLGMSPEKGALNEFDSDCFALSTHLLQFVERTYPTVGFEFHSSGGGGSKNFKRREFVTKLLAPVNAISLLDELHGEAESFLEGRGYSNSKPLTYAAPDERCIGIGPGNINGQVTIRLEQVSGSQYLVVQGFAFD